jgi:hypothetical protein
VYRSIEIGCYWIHWSPSPQARDPVTKSNDSKFIDLLLDLEHSLCAGVNLNISHLAAKPLSIFLRALENMAEHHREMMHRPVLSFTRCQLPTTQLSKIDSGGERSIVIVRSPPNCPQ